MDKVTYYSAAQVREVDRLAIEERGIPGIVLMQRAAQAAFNLVLTRWPDVRQVHIFCGTGNNGGDGLLLAILTQAAGIHTQVWLAGQHEKVRGTAAEALHAAQQAGVAVTPATELKTLSRGSDTVLVDALLGTGLQGEVRAPYRPLIHLINQSGLPVLALDIPSGLCSDTGQVLGEAVQAEATITFIGRKLGQQLGEGPEHCGVLYLDTLDVPEHLFTAAIEGVQA